MIVYTLLLLCFAVPALGFFGFGSKSPVVKTAGGVDAKSIFDFTVEDISSKPISLSKFKGKRAYVVVNVASK